MLPTPPPPGRPGSLPGGTELYSRIDADLADKYIELGALERTLLERERHFAEVLLDYRSFQRRYLLAVGASLPQLEQAEREIVAARKQVELARKSDSPARAATSGAVHSLAYHRETAPPGGRTADGARPGVAGERARVAREISRIHRRIRSIEEQFLRLTDTELYRLKVQVAERAQGSVLLDGIAANLHRQTGAVWGKAETPVPRAAGETRTRSIVFPAHRSLGQLSARDWESVRVRTWDDVSYGALKPLGEARGMVTVAADMPLRLSVDCEAPVDLAPLADLEPDAIQELSLEGPLVANESLGHIRGLTGLQEIKLIWTSVTDPGLGNLADLTDLRSILLYGESMILGGPGRPSITEDGLRHLVRLPKLRELGLSWIGTTDRGLSRVRELTELRWLRLPGAAITDAGVAGLGSLVELQGLDLSKTTVTDRGLRHLRGLDRLEWLVLSGTGVTDDGLRHLRALDGLRWLHLGDTAITDVGVRRLASLTGLRCLHLPGTRVSEAGLRALSRALPGCRIRR